MQREPISGAESPRTRHLRAVRAACAALAAWALLAPVFLHAARVAGLYEATVPLADRSDTGQADALQAAMRQVLVRVTGRRDAGDDPALAPLVTDARRYVQQFRVIGGNQFFAGFDGAKVERAVTDAGQPLWGHERPATLVVMMDERSHRVVQGRDEASDLKRAVVRGAQLRGLPLVWPDEARPIDAAAASAGAVDKLGVAATEYGADAVLVGVGSGTSALTWQGRWTLVQGTETSQWRGNAEDGAQGASDWFAGVFAAADSPEGAEVAITVGGIGDLRAYANVTSYLESLALIRALAVDQVAGDTVVYRARIQGDADRLARAIGLGRHLQPATPAGAAAGSASLDFRYRP
jgi:hypothetical protein